MSGPTLQGRLAQTNAGFFLREFSFSRTHFDPAGGTEVELADHVVSFDDVLLLFQFKEREATTGDSTAEERWFTNKVGKKAVSQVRDTLNYLAAGPIRLANDRGHLVDLPGGLAGLRVAKVIVYRPGDALPEPARRQKGHLSSSAGFIHFFQARDYEGVLETLVTLPEIVNYLGYRERLCRRFPLETRLLSEHAMVGHYLLGDESAIPREGDAARVLSLQNNVEEFDILGLLNLFKDRAYAMKRPDGATETPTDYYEVLKEMVRLPREGLAAFKLRYKWAWDQCGMDGFVRPSRFASGTTGCGFVFIPMSSAASAHAGTALANFTEAAKYDLKVDRCLGVVFRRDGSDRLIDWMHHVHPWEPDAELEALLKENYPFREAKIAFVPRYTFGTGGSSIR